MVPYYDLTLKTSTVRRLACEVVRADLRDADLRELLDGVDVVFHQAGQPGVRASWDGFASYVEHNVVATQRLLEAARRTPLRRFVYASSSSIYGDASTFPTSEEDLPRPISPYGVTKLAAEHLCMVYAHSWGVPTVSLRYFTVYGPGQRPDMAFHEMIESALAGRPFPVFGDGRQVRDFTFVDDVVDANLLAATEVVAPGTVINIAGGTATTVLEVAALLGDLLGRPVSLEHRPAEAGDVRRTGGSTERAARILGWRPRVTLERGLGAQLSWHLARRSDPAADGRVEVRSR